MDVYSFLRELFFKFLKKRKNMITPDAQETKNLLEAGKVLRATFVAREARKIGDNTPTEILMEHVDHVAKIRAEVFNALPHDTFKCPHSH